MARAKTTATAVSAATVGAVLMIANQVASKATRDALFLSHFPVTDLPTMLIASSLVSLVVVLAISKLMARRGPGLLVPAIFGVSAAGFVGEWLVIEQAPRTVAIVLFLHVAALGATLVSGFWSLVNERFDPHTAKQSIGRIAGGATLGGLLGGIIAERVGAMASSISAMLPGLAIMHGVCALVVLALRGAARVQEPPPNTSAVDSLARNPYLRRIALLVFLLTLSAAFLDFVFKSHAAARYEGDALLRFFAVFYTAIGALTFLVQALVSRVALEKLGLARTVTILPAALVGGSLSVIILPGIGAAGAAFAAESILRGSLFRSGYELLYTPISPQQKRATKTIIDVGVDRVGDAIGGGFTRLVLLLIAPAAAAAVLLSAAAAVGLVAVLVAVGLQRGYVRALEKSLLHRAGELDLSRSRDFTGRNSVMQTIGAINLSQAFGRDSGAELLARDISVRESRELPAVAQRAPSEAPLAPSSRSDELLMQVTALRSGDSVRVMRALSGSLSPELIGHVIPLLAWDEVSAAAVAALRPLSERCTGQLLDALLDPGQEFAIRRRIPRVLGNSANQRAVAGLLAALEDKRFEVRFQAGRALAALLRQRPELAPTRAVLFAALEREVQVDRRVWESRRLLDDHDESLFINAAERTRESYSLEHLFTLLSLVLPKAPLQVAFRGLQTDDDSLRGTALEYLDSVLPAHLRDALSGLLEARPRLRRSATSRDPLERLMQSKKSIDLNLEELRKRLGDSSQR